MSRQVVICLGDESYLAYIYPIDALVKQRTTRKPEVVISSNPFSDAWSGWGGITADTPYWMKQAKIRTTKKAVEVKYMNRCVYV